MVPVIVQVPLAGSCNSALENEHFAVGQQRGRVKIARGLERAIGGKTAHGSGPLNKKKPAHEGGERHCELNVALKEAAFAG
jgi:hypothetical protein